MYRVGEGAGLVRYYQLPSEVGPLAVDLTTADTCRGSQDRASQRSDDFGEQPGRTMDGKRIPGVLKRNEFHWFLIDFPISDADRKSENGKVPEKHK